MKGLVLHTPLISRGKKLPLLALVDTLSSSASISRKTISPSPSPSPSRRCREISSLSLGCGTGTVRAQASNVSIGSEGYEGWGEKDNQKIFTNSPPSDSSSEMEGHRNRMPYPLSIALVRKEDLHYS